MKEILIIFDSKYNLYARVLINNLRNKLNGRIVIYYITEENNEIENQWSDLELRKINYEKFNLQKPI